MSRLNNLYLFLNDEKGRTLPRAKLFFYENESFDFKPTYADKALTAINPNPVIADGAGRFPNIFLEPNTYRVVLQDEDGVEISTKDDVDNLISDGDDISNTTVTTSTGPQTVAGALDDRVVRANSIAEVQALTPSNQYQVSLAGSPSGAFEFSNTNLAGLIDDYDYIAPASDPTGASGAWVRFRQAPRINEPITVQEADISALNVPLYGYAHSPESSKFWEFSLTVNGLENTPDTIKMADGRYANRSGGYKPQRLGVFKTSAGLGHRCGDFVYRKNYQTDADLITDLSRYIPYTIDDVDDPNVTVGYVDWQKINDNTGDGLSWANAKASIDAGEGLGTDILLIRGGFYNRVNRLQSFSVAKDRSFIAVGGPVVAGSIATGTWTKTGGQANVYQLDYASGLTNITSRVFDTAKLTTENSPDSYQNVGDIATVDATPGSFFHDTTTTYVHASDSRDLVIHGDELRLVQPVSLPQITFTGNHKLYFEGIHHWGGLGGTTELISNGTSWPGSVFYNKNCVFSGCFDGAENGLNVRDIGICISEGSESSSNRRDGFNYHNYLAGASGVDGLAPHFVEINCQAHGNGLGGAEGNNQGTTAHEDCVGFRINGDYSGHTDGGCVVDINGAKVYNVNISAKNSSTAGMLLSGDGFSGIDAEWWIDGAKCSGNPAVGNASGDIAVDGFQSIIHLEDTDTEKPLSTRTFSDNVQTPDKDFS